MPKTVLTNKKQIFKIYYYGYKKTPVSNRGCIEILYLKLCNSILCGIQPHHHCHIAKHCSHVIYLQGKCRMFF